MPVSSRETRGNADICGRGNPLWLPFLRAGTGACPYKCLQHDITVMPLCAAA